MVTVRTGWSQIVPLTRSQTLSMTRLTLKQRCHPRRNRNLQSTCDSPHLVRCEVWPQNARRNPFIPTTTGCTVGCVEHLNIHWVWPMTNECWEPCECKEKPLCVRWVFSREWTCGRNALVDLRFVCASMPAHYFAKAVTLLLVGMRWGLLMESPLTQGFQALSCVTACH